MSPPANICQVFQISKYTATKQGLDLQLTKYKSSLLQTCKFWFCGKILKSTVQPGSGFTTPVLGAIIQFSAAMHATKQCNASKLANIGFAVKIV